MSMPSPSPAPAPLEKPYAESRWQPQRMVWWYWAVIDEMVANPQVSKKDLATRFGVSYVCIQLVTTSDIFQHHYSERVKEKARGLDTAINERLTKVALGALEHLGSALEKKRDTIPIKDLAAIAEMSLQKLGYGVQTAAGITVNNNLGSTTVVAPVSRSDLEAARANLRAVEQGKILEGKVE